MWSRLRFGSNLMLAKIFFTKVNLYAILHQQHNIFYTKYLHIMCMRSLLLAFGMSSDIRYIAHDGVQCVSRGGRKNMFAHNIFIIGRYVVYLSVTVCIMNKCKNVNMIKYSSV